MVHLFNYQTITMKTISTYYKTAFVLVLLSLAVSLQAQRNRRYYRYDTRYYPVRGQQFLHIPGPFINIHFGGNPYYYSGGLFYQPFGSYYRIIPPPFGIRIGILPRGYWSLTLGGYPYFYYNGIFYRKSNNDYEVVKAPVGAEVPSIPRDAKTVVIDGSKYYEYNGTYYRETIRSNGEIWYTVEGKNGVLNTDKTATVSQPPVAIPDGSNAGPSIGDVVDKLPENTKTVVINSKKYFVSTDNIYYEEIVDGNQVRYKVAGK